MPIDTSIYQNIKPVEMPSMLDSQAKAANLSSMAMQNMEGAQKVQAGDRAAHLEKAAAFGEALNGMAGLTPEQRAQVWPEQRAKLIQEGVISPDQYPEQHDEGLYRQNLMRYRQTEPFIKKDLQAAQAEHFRSEAMKNRAEAGKLKPSGPINPSDDPAKMVPQMVPKEHQAAAFKEIDAAENTKKMAKSIIDSFDQAVGDVSGLGGGLALVRSPRSVLALHQAMQPTFKDLEGTVRQAAMDNTFKNITPSPTDTAKEIQTKRQALQDYLQSKLSAPTARGYGIDLAKFESTSPYQAPKLKTKDGSNKIIQTAVATERPNFDAMSADDLKKYLAGGK